LQDVSTEPGPSRAIADVGPFFHGTRANLRIGDLLTAGAEMARGHGGPRVYVVEPLGDFQNDPNVTDKKSSGHSSDGLPSAWARSSTR